MGCIDELCTGARSNRYCPVAVKVGIHLHSASKLHFHHPNRTWTSTVYVQRATEKAVIANE